MGFFDNLSKKATETYKNTTEKTNKLAREMKLKASISDKKTKIQSIYTEIGKKVYEKHIREENIDIKSELADECGQIDALSKEIEDMNTEMRALKDIRLCKTCAAEIAFEAKFCPKCGAAQDNIEVKTEVVVEPAEQVAEQPTESASQSVQEENTEAQPTSTIYANTGKEIVETGAQNLAEIPSREIANIENHTETETAVNEENNTETETVVNEENNNDEETEIVVDNNDNQ